MHPIKMYLHHLSSWRCPNVNVKFGKAKSEFGFATLKIRIKLVSMPCPATAVYSIVCRLPFAHCVCHVISHRSCASGGLLVS